MCSPGAVDRNLTVAGDLTIFVHGGFVGREAGTNIIQRHMVRCYRNAHMARIAQKYALFVAVGVEITDSIVPGKTWLGHHLVNDPVEFLQGIEIIVGFEDGGDVVAEQ